MSGMWTKPIHTAYRIFINNGVHNSFVCLRMILVPQKFSKFCLLFCLSGLMLINFDSQESKFPMMFNMFVNLFWKAEGFGITRVQFELRSVNYFFFLIALSNKKN